MDEKEYIRFLTLENDRLKRQLNSKPILQQWLDMERIKIALQLLTVGFILGFLIVPSPMRLLFPKPVNQVLDAAKCGTNAVYDKLGI